MKKNLLKVAFFALFSTSLVLTSCKKEEDSQEETYLKDNTDVGNDNLASRLFDESDDLAEQAIENDLITIYGKLLPESNAPLLDKANCATISRVTTANAIDVTIDFGTSNCTCEDGKTRRGKIKVHQERPFHQAGKKRIVTYENYFVNDNELRGTRTVTFMGYNTAQQPYVTIEIPDGQMILANNAGTVTYITSRVRTHIEGFATGQLFNDDVFQITGTKTVTSPGGNQVTATIINPLIKKRTTECREIVSGSVKYVKTGKPDKIVDFGAGECDHIATITVGSRPPRTVSL